MLLGVVLRVRASASASASGRANPGTAHADTTTDPPTPAENLNRVLVVLAHCLWGRGRSRGVWVHLARVFGPWTARHDHELDWLKFRNL